MYRIVQQIARQVAGTPSHRHLWSSYGVSAAVHLSLLAALGCVWVTAVNVHATPGGIDSGWQNASRDFDDDPLQLEIVELPTVESPVVASRENSDGASAQATATRPVEVAVANTTASSSAPLLSDGFPADGLGDEIALATPGSGTGGNGSSSGQGPGDGGGFFGLDAHGQKVVFVVDCSKSMNHPHPSPAKTRFRVLKLELLRTITSMDESREFFIIFFNEEAIPMPASAMQPATLHAQKQYLTWMQKVRAVGDTDPRQALLLALRLQPDVIYLLTDGDFLRPIKRDLLELEQQHTAIHTIAFGNPLAEPFLRTLAEKNRGKFRFIP